MSGGSFNYLCYADTSEIVTGEHDSEIGSMIDTLQELGAKDIADDTRKIIDLSKEYREKVETLRASLENVWHAVEWNMSGDSGEDAVKEAIKKYRTKESINA